MTLDSISYPKKSIFEIITQMVADAHAGFFNEDFKPDNYALPLFDLESYLDLFVDLPESAFSNELENKIAEYLTEHISILLRQCGNQSINITLAPTPFVFPGKPLSGLDYINETEANVPLTPSYLTILYSEAGDKRGLCKATGWLKPMPLLAILPPEIRNKCTIEFSSLSYFNNPSSFEANIRIAYRELLQLLVTYRQNKKKT